MSQTQNLAKLDPAGLTQWAFRNKIINGNFDIWQRGTSAVTTGYLADRWRTDWDGSGLTITVSRQSFTLGQNVVPNEPTYFYRFAQTVAGTGSTVSTLQHRIEGVRSLAGKTATISFWAKADSNRSMTVSMAQSFGSGGSPSAQVVGIGSTGVGLGASWQKYIVTVNIPSISGKTLGSNNDDYLVLALSFPFNVTQTIDIAQVQIEGGIVATNYEMRPLGFEYSLCYRYYFKDTGISIQRYAGLASSLIIGSRNFPTPMRAVPAVAMPACSYVANSSAGNANTGSNLNYNIIATSAGAGDMYLTSIIITADAEL